MVKLHNRGQFCYVKSVKFTDKKKKNVSTLENTILLERGGSLCFRIGRFHRVEIT